MICVYSASRNLYPYLKPAILSLLEHNECEVILLVEDDDIGYELPDCCRCINVRESGQELFRNSPNFGTAFTYLAMIRAAYSKWIDADRIIQLDVDTIVCDSLEEIWNVDMTDAHYAAVPEYKGRFKPYGEKYYNVGVAVFNLKLIRETGMDSKLVNFLNTNRVPYIDQDAYNALCKATDLPVRFNECFVTGYTDNPAVVHYAGIRNWWRDKGGFRHEYYEKYETR